MKELSVKLHLYLEMKADETEEEASDRLFLLLQELEFRIKGFTTGEFLTTTVYHDDNKGICPITTNL